jgi:hypothetical protein
MKYSPFYFILKGGKYMNYDDMSISELKDYRAKKLIEYSVKREDYTELCDRGLYIKDEKLKEELNKKLETIDNEIDVLEDLIYGLDYLIYKKYFINKRKNK